MPRQPSVRSPELEKILARLYGGEGVHEEALRIGAIYRTLQQPIIISSNGQGSSETDKPWKLPGQSSQDPKQAPPPKREREQDDNKTA
jgi:hypothetical protein